jgi:hypothetical protein
VSVVQRPAADRYSPTDVGLTSRLDVPIATHELSLVHATVDSGTEILTAGRPVTCGFIAGVVVAHAANSTAPTEHIVTIRTRERTEAGTRIIASL